MKILLLPVLGLLVGAALGLLAPVTIPLTGAKYLSVAILTLLDAIMGGLAHLAEGRFRAPSFALGFLLNACLATCLVLAGARLGLDLYYVALLAFGLRIFRNLARLRETFLGGAAAGHKDMKIS